MSIVVQRNYQIREPVETHQTARKILKAGKHLFTSSVMHRWLPSECGVAGNEHKTVLP